MDSLIHSQDGNKHTHTHTHTPRHFIVYIKLENRSPLLMHTWTHRTAGRTSPAAAFVRRAQWRLVVMEEEEGAASNPPP